MPISSSSPLEKISNINTTTNTNNLWEILSFYSPTFLTLGIFIMSIFTASVDKYVLYIFWVFIATILRMGVMWKFGDEKILPTICQTGKTLPFSTPTYSTYIMIFTLTYFVLPMILMNKNTGNNSVNYGAIMFFVAYILYDLFMKMQLKCISSLFTATVASDVIGGMLLGVIVGVLLYSSPLKNKLFINEITSNDTVCSRPSEQQFKCKVYKNGELVQN
jgi:hypothetical protein